MLYHKKIEAKEQILKVLTEKKETLLEEKLHSLSLQEDLLLRISSRNDPAYLELALMRGLGVVPEGQVKVHFEK